MEYCPRFGKIFKGCNFEAAYDISAPDLSMFSRIHKIDSDALEAFRPKKYIHHVCVTCGKISKGEIK